ncbi:MAG: S1 family peptidase [Burkholderiales bacterium]
MVFLRTLLIWLYGLLFVYPVAWADGKISPSELLEPVEGGGASDYLQAFASKVGVSPEEAAKRRRIMDSIPEDLETQLSAEPTFAGLWLQQEPEFRVVVQFKKTGVERGRILVSEQAASVWMNWVEVRSVAVSLAELAAGRAKIEAALKTMDIPFESGTDIMDNSVEILVTQPVQDLLVKMGVDPPPYVKIKVVEQLSEPLVNVRAGHALRSSTGVLQCTSGFNVKNSAGTRGVLTAGHCSNTEYSRGDGTTLRNLPFQSQRYGGSYDVQWHTAPNFVLTNDVNIPTGFGFTKVAGIKSRSQQLINEFVCKLGAVTGETCGFVVRKDWLPPTSCIPNPTATYMRVNRCTGCSETMAMGGDSGSPVYRYGGSTGTLVTAYGLLSCGSTLGDNFIYMASV